MIDTRGARMIVKPMYLVRLVLPAMTIARRRLPETEGYLQSIDPFTLSARNKAMKLSHEAARGAYESLKRDGYKVFIEASE